MSNGPIPSTQHNPTLHESLAGLKNLADLRDDGPEPDRGRLFAERAAELLGPEPIPPPGPPERPEPVPAPEPEPDQGMTMHILMPAVPRPDVPSGGYPDVSIRLKEDFKEYVREFMEAVRAFCRKSSGGDQDIYVSKGARYRWKFVQGETPRKPIMHVFKISTDGDLVKSDTVKFTLAGKMYKGPEPLAEVWNGIYEASERRKAEAEAVRLAIRAAAPAPRPPEPPPFSRPQLELMKDCINRYIKGSQFFGARATDESVVEALTCIDWIEREIDSGRPDSARRP